MIIGLLCLYVCTKSIYIFKNTFSAVQNRSSSTSVLFEFDTSKELLLGIKAVDDKLSVGKEGFDVSRSRGGASCL